jgi:hypothetical protein
MDHVVPSAPTREGMVKAESLHDALAAANLARLEAIKSGHEADHIIADYYVARLELVVATNELIQRMRERLDK